MFNKKKKKYNATKNDNKNASRRNDIRNNDLDSIYEGFPSGMYATPQNEPPKKSQKSAVKSGNRGVLSVYVLFFVLCSIYILGCAYGFITKKVVNYDVVQLGVIDTPKTVQGVIIRDEKVYNAGADGVINYNVADNEKVKKNTEVCNIKDEAVVKALEEELNSIDEDIIKLQSERKDISIYSEDVKQDNTEIRMLIDDNAMDYAKKNFGGIYELKNSIQKKMDIRNELLLSENKGTLVDLVTQRNQQIAKLNNNIAKIVVDEGGIVSFNLDGMENKYTISSIATLSEKDTKVTSSSVSSFKTSVKKDTPAFKLVKSNEWYIACYIPGEYVKEWEKGNLVMIYAKDNMGQSHDLTAEIYELSGSENDKQRYCVLKISKDMTDFINNRSINFDLEKATSGYKIKNSAIVEETLMKIPLDYVNEEDGYVVKADNKKVSVIISDKDTANNVVYIPVQLGTLNVGDKIKKPFTDSTFDIKEVLNTKGVYVVNTGYAEFKRIYADDAVSNNTHTILSVSKNPNINMYDRIITDTDNIQREQKVYS